MNTRNTKVMTFKVIDNKVFLTMVRVSASNVLQSHSFFGAVFSKYFPLIELLKEVKIVEMHSHKIWRILANIFNPKRLSIHNCTSHILRS